MDVIDLMLTYNATRHSSTNTPVFHKNANAAIIHTPHHPNTHPSSHRLSLTNPHGHRNSATASHPLSRRVSAG